MSRECGLLSAREPGARAARWSSCAGLPTRIAARSTPTRMLEHMRIDKKVLAGRVRLVLLQRIGDAFVTADYPEAALSARCARTADEAR